VIASGLITARLLLFVTTATVTSVFVASAARNFTNIVDSHTASEQRNGQEEADKEHRNGHKDPGNRFEADVAESLEDAGTEDCDGDPVENTEKITDQKMVENTGDADQKNNGRRLAEFDLHSILGGLFYYKN
jgi:hypothetical protein